MKVNLSPDQIDALPEADGEGIIRVTASLRMQPGGDVELVELNDQPVPSGASDDEAPGAGITPPSDSDIY